MAATEREYARPEVRALLAQVNRQDGLNNERRQAFSQWLGPSTYFIAKVSGLAANGAQGIADTYVRLIFRTADSSAGMLETIGESLLAQLGETFSATRYYHFVKGLADQMTKASIIGKPGTDESFWLAAEEHFHALVAGIMRSSKSTAEALHALADVLQVFSSETHLGRIRRRAFEIWSSSAKEHDPLHYWLIAEQEFLDILMRRGRIDDDEAEKGRQRTEYSPTASSGVTHLPEKFVGSIYLPKGTREQVDELADAATNFLQALGYDVLVEEAL